jgi:hypothetical protein
MKGKSEQRKMVQGYFLYSRVRFLKDYNGRGEGWYFMLSPRKAYGPFPNKDVANTVLEGLLNRLANGESEENFQEQA